MSIDNINAVIIKFVNCGYIIRAPKGNLSLSQLGRQVIQDINLELDQAQYARKGDNQRWQGIKANKRPKPLI